jgi:nitroimidazol reductase NimA-like FMN-containing flavoprotein (pyridoxamine 5'-phosphate oxidase superfamily)
MTVDECRRMLRTGRVGRLVHTDGALPAVTPVSYQLLGAQLLFRLPILSALASALPGTIVAVEADDFDPFSGVGWSVVVIGEARVWPTQPPTTSDAVAPRPSTGPVEHQVFTLSKPIMRGVRMAID